MSKYKALPIDTGVGVVHLNRFRISVKPPANRAQVGQIGANLQAGLLNYMDPATAGVRLGDHPWNGKPTLKFRGVARFRPFSVPLIGLPAWVPVPGFLRDWMIPDLHTDSVGVVAQHKTGFTVQTLKREYEDKDDKEIRKAVGKIKLVGAVGGIAARVLIQALENTAVHFNQHHFLAGRRAFRVDFGTEFDYTDDRVVFETVAIERFSHVVFEKGTIAMGTIENLIRHVWVGMLNRFAKWHGFTVINEAPKRGWKVDKGVHYLQERIGYAAGAIARHAQYPDMNDEHDKLLPH